MMKSLSCAQKTLHEAFRRKYDKKHEQYKFITRKLALFVGGTNVANSVVENTVFRSLLEALNSLYQYQTRKNIDKLMIDKKAKVGEFLSHSLCADIRIKKGLSSLYLGITAHFPPWLDRKCHQVTLVVRKMPHPHNAEHILELTESVLQD